MDTLQSVRTTLSAISNNTQPSAQLKSDWKSRRRKRTSCLNTWQGAEGSCCPNLMLQASAWTLLSDLGSGPGDRSQNARFGPSGKNHGVQHNCNALNLNRFGGRLEILTASLWHPPRTPTEDYQSCTLLVPSLFNKTRQNGDLSYYVGASTKKKEKIPSQPKALTSLCVKSCMGKSSRAPASI